jgi:hypothetical protein
MADETKLKYLEDMARYNSADAGMYAISKAEKGEQGIFLQGTCKTLIDRLYDPSTPDLDILKQAATASQEGMQIMLQETYKKYESAYKQCTISNLYFSNAKIIDKIVSKDKKEKFNAILGKYGNKSIGSILNDYNDAQVIQQGSDKLFDKAKKEKADKTLEELEPMVAILSQIKKLTTESSDDYKKLREYACQEILSQEIDKIKV